MASDAFKRYSLNSKPSHAYGKAEPRQNTGLKKFGL